MAKIDFEFDHGKSPAGKGGMYFRLVAIFVLVAAITGGLIWYFWPAPESAPEDVPPVKVETGGENGDEEDNGEVISSNVPGPVGGGDQEKIVVTLPDDGTPVSEENGVDPVAGEDATKAAGAEAGETPTILPVKGKPWIGDGPDSAGDTPVSAIPVANLPGWEKKMTELDGLLDAKKYTAAIPLCHELLSMEGIIPGSGEYREIAKALTEANLAVMAGNAASSELLVHSAKSGESYSLLAAKYHTTIGAIKSINRIPASDNNLRVGQTLKIYPGPWSIRVEKGAKLLKLYNRDKLFALFDVGLGRMGKTPTASFVISVKVGKPDWYSPNGGVVKYGDPDNPLGDYFLKLAPTGAPDRPLLGYGIHGTKDDADVTRSLSNGCVRMRNRDVEKLYLFVPARTPVEIVD